MSTSSVQFSVGDGRVARAARQRSGIALTLAVLLAADAQAAETRDWALSAYRVHCVVAVDATIRPQPELEAAIVRSICERGRASVAPLWQLKVAAAQNADERRQCFAPAELGWDSLSSDQKSFDKLFSLGARATPRGYELTCREFDVYLRRWGPVERREVVQASFLNEGCLELLLAAFAPLATIEPVLDNDEQVRLIFKGSALPTRTEANPFIKAGDAFLPLLRRTDRTGELLKNGIIPVPWTYLTAVAPGDEGPAAATDSPGEASPWYGQVHTGMRRPFGVQRRGFVHQVAIGLRNKPGPTQVRFHSRSDKEQGLAGYDVFRAGVDGASPTLIGKTDRFGVITIPPGDGLITTVLLRSEGQLLAKIPAPSGLPEVMEAPIADNLSRLRAQAESQVVREELIDVVARRAIMIARTRSLLKQGRVDDARQLMMKLDELPTSATFGRTIDQASNRIPPSKDAAVQQKIERLFSSTRELLSKFLNSRPISELQAEVNAAANAPRESPDKGEANTGG